MYSPIEKCMSMMYKLKDIRNEEIYIVQIFLTFFLFHTTSLDQSTEISVYIKTGNFLITTVYLD